VPSMVSCMDKVAIVRCSDYTVSTVKNAIMESFGFFGGADKYIKPGETVLLKPNLIVASKEDGATTDARFIEAVIEIVKDQHAIPMVGDSPAFGSATGVAKSVGILEVLERQKIDIVEFKKNIPSREGIKITKSLKDFDKVINLPKLKAHNQVRFTGATKNLFGLTKGKIKAWQHVIVRNNLEKFCLMILRIYDCVRPAFTLVDAIDIMEGQGPRGGPMRRFGFVFSGVNCLSIDTVMAKCLGIDMDEAPLLHLAKRNGYKGTFLDEIEVKGESIENVRINDFAYPETLSDISFSLKGVVKSLFHHLWLLYVKEHR
jgi:uncharacterized protein (DUF362 family)